MNLVVLLIVLLLLFGGGGLYLGGPLIGGSLGGLILIMLLVLLLTGGTEPGIAVKLPSPDERHLRRHHRHELHVRIERKARHIDDRAHDVRDVEARLRRRSHRWPAARRPASAPSCPSPHCQCRSARTRCCIAGRRGTTISSGR